MRSLPLPLSPLGEYKQFVLYEVTPSTTRPGKTDKIPVHLQGLFRVNAHDPSNWSTAEVVCARASQLGSRYGVGFVVTAQDPFFFIDLDDCLTPEGWSAQALAICARFPGAAIEISNSGKGLHIFGKCPNPPSHGTRNDDIGMEAYTSLRFAALTGTGAMGLAATDHTAAFYALAAQYLGEGTRATEDMDWTTTPVPEWRGPENDDDLIRRALMSRSAGGMFDAGKATFRDLWERNVDVLAQAYPEERGTGPYNDSSADAALAQHLAFWTGNNCERIRSLMMQSGLYRSKYDREDYLVRTIAGPTGAVFKCREWCVDKPVVENAPPPSAVTSAETASTATSSTAYAEPSELRSLTSRYAEREGKPEAQESRVRTVLSPGDQPQIFAGCCYVLDQHKILIPGGRLVKPDQFRVMFSGYLFTIDSSNGKTTRDPWELFVRSETHKYPKADSLTFRPSEPAGQITERSGSTYVNAWWPIQTPAVEGDISPFLRHMEMLLPDERDRTILLSYLAAIVQFPGVKFQWAPLIQGVEGNGKTLFSLVATEAVGERYAFWPRADQIGSQFNAWQMSRILICVEDVFVPEKKQELLEILKPMITGERAAVEPKTVDQFMMNICCNYILNCNDKTALRKSRNDRRIAPFFTRQQSKEDLIRDGMNEAYYQALYAWLRDVGFARITWFLRNYAIPDELNPANGYKAPKTSSTEEALNLSIGSVEQEVMESVEQEVPGFCGGWVSSAALDRMLERMGWDRRIPRNKRRGLMQSLGYDWHPALPNGRVHNAVMPDNVKCRLYVKVDSPLREISEPARVAHTYTQAQAPAPVTPFRVVSS